MICTVSFSMILASQFLNGFKFKHCITVGPKKWRELICGCLQKKILYYWSRVIRSTIKTLKQQSYCGIGGVGEERLLTSKKVLT